MHRAACSFSIVAMLGGTVAAAAADGDAKLKAYGKHLAAECTACHRIDGVDNGIPAIIGWPASNFTSAIEAYQTGARTNPVMVSVAQSLDAQQIAALAAYLGSLAKPASAPGKGPGALRN